MSVPKFLRKVFGASENDQEVEFDDFDKPEAAPRQQAAQGPAQGAGREIAAGEMPVELLDAILSIINAQLPPVAAQCINPDAQRRYLASCLGSHLAEYAESLKRKAVSELTGDRKKMQTELETLRAERKDVSSKREEQKAALLSEQRQRRALTDRNRDLENKIAELDSEIEQHKLTISSLMNKMRVAEVTEEDSATMRDDLKQLREQLAAKDAELAEKVAAIEAKDAELASTRQSIDELNAKVAELEAARLQHQEAAAEAGEPSAAPRKRRGRPRKTNGFIPADDDTSMEIDSVDWLLPGGVPAGHVPHTSDPDFGYQPPKHAPAPDSDAQLTLF